MVKNRSKYRQVHVSAHAYKVMKIPHPAQHKGCLKRTMLLLRFPRGLQFGLKLFKILVIVIYMVDYHGRKSLFEIFV